MYRITTISYISDLKTLIRPYRTIISVILFSFSIACHQKPNETVASGELGRRPVGGRDGLQNQSRLKLDGYHNNIDDRIITAEKLIVSAYKSVFYCLSFMISGHMKLVLLRANSETSQIQDSLRTFTEMSFQNWVGFRQIYPLNIN